MLDQSYAAYEISRKLSAIFVNRINRYVMLDQSYAAYEISRKLSANFESKANFVVDVLRTYDLAKCASQHCFAAPLREKLKNWF